MAVRMVVRSLLRERRRSLLGLALVLALLGGVGLGSLAGARRTQSAYPRFQRWDRTTTIAVDAGRNIKLLNRAAHFPEVVDSQRYDSFDTAFLKHGQPDFSQDFEALASYDGRYFKLDRFAVLEGRLPNVHRIDEIAVNRYGAGRLGLRVGQRVDIGTYDDAEVSSPNGDPSKLRPKERMLATVVGIGLFPEEIIQDESDRSSLILFTPAYAKQAQRLATYSWMGYTLRHGAADVEPFRARYRKVLPKGYPEFYRITSGITFHAEQAIRPLSIALGLFGVAALGAGVVLTVLACGRAVAAAGQDRATLRALGLSRRNQILILAAGPLLGVLAGALGALMLAWLLSPIMPLGPMRKVEVDRGLDVDAAVLGLGLLGLVAIGWAASLAFAYRSATADRRIGRRAAVSRTSIAASRAGFGVASVVGLRHAFEPGNGRSQVSVRSVVAATAIAIAALVSALTFSSSLHHLTTHPSLYGWDWDSGIISGAGYYNFDTKTIDRALKADRDVAAWGGFNFGAGSVDRLTVPMLGAQPNAAVTPPLTSGRAPVRSDEVALGAQTARQLGKGVGDLVSVRSDDGPHQFRVTGIAVLPTVGIVHGEHTSLGTGIWLPVSRIPGVARQFTPGAHVGPNIVFIRFRPDVDHAAAVRRLKGLIDRLPDPYGGGHTYIGVQRPAEIVNTSDLGSAPAILAAMMIIGSVIALGLTLGASVRQRRRELALVRTLGFTNRQLASVVLWQSTATVIAGTLVGVPLGLVAGRWAWIAFAHQLQVLARPATPLVALGLLVAGAVIVANVVALVPGLVAGRTSAAEILRAE